MKLGKPPFWAWSPWVLGFIIAMLLITYATAQIELPRTALWTNGKGETVGTATFHGDRIYFRDLDGKHIMTIVTNANGTTLYDPSGNVLDHKAAPTK